MLRYLFPGSFDPPTVGHRDLIRRASRLCDELVIAVMVNPDKMPLFTVEERKEMLLLACEGCDNIKVTAFDGMLVDLYRRLEASAVVRGIRGEGDFSYERRMSEINRDLEENCETIFLSADRGLIHVSSSMVRELVSLGQDVSAYVPENCAGLLQKGWKRLESRRG